MRIAIYCIAKNEAKFVKRMMDSVRDADGVFVLDTGSSDGTAALFQAEGATVEGAVITPWRFDTARNKALELVPADYDLCIALDVDEIMYPGWRLALEQGWKDTATRGRYEYIWSHKADGSPDLIYWADKIHARQGYRWRHPVHEILHRDDGLDVQQTILGLKVEHFPDSSKPRGSYFPLLELAVQEDPEDDRNAHYLGREYFNHRMWNLAEAELQRHLRLPRAVWAPERAASMRYLAKIAAERGQRDEQTRWLLRACAEAPDEREPWVELAQAYYAQQNHDGSLFAAMQALRIPTRPRSYITEEFAWGAAPHDLASVSSWYAGGKMTSLHHALVAAHLCPTDQRLRDNIVNIEAGLMDPYGTHQRMLAAAIVQSSGPVVECGVGHYSTPLLHGLCAGGRELWSFDTNPTWVQHFRPLASPKHHIVGIHSWDDIPNEKWGVAFIDCEISQRAALTARMLERADLVVLHDTEDPQYRYNDALAGVAWQVTDKSRTPWTTVASKTPHPDFSY